MPKLLLAFALVLSLLGSCTIHRHPGAQAPRRWIRYYRHEQRRHERARRRLERHKTNVTWSQL